MLVLKTPYQIIWPDLQFIEAPMHARRSLERNIKGSVGCDYIDNTGGFNICPTTNSGLGVSSLLEHQIENGQAFVINRNTQFPSLNPIHIKNNDQIVWSFKFPANDMLRNAMEGIMHRVDRPGRYTYADTSNEDTSVTEVQTKKVKEKHKLNIKYQLVDGADYPEQYKVKMCIYNETKKIVTMRQLMDVMKVGSSKVFSLEQGETFSIYPMREHMTDVEQDFLKNKNFNQSVKNGRIKPLEIEASEEINDEVTLHTVTIKVPPILRMGCFFDGTGNDESNPEKYSNVQKLSGYYNRAQTKSFRHRKYIRGVGSEGDGFLDKALGGAAGKGALERIAGMLFELEEACKMYVDTFKSYPEEIFLDVFGFSRGATTARHFMNVIKQGFYGFNNQNLQAYISPKNIQFSFVGLFDSVGSYGIPGDNSDYGYNFHVKQKWLTDKAQLIHLIALNEYRSNFDLQTIFDNQSRDYPEDRKVGSMQEIGLIGAHSDVGGSYGPNEQGVTNNDTNPSQLSLMALEKMHQFAKASGVPMADLDMSDREVGLIDNYAVLEDTLQNKSLRKLVLQWIEYKKYNQILNHKIERLPIGGKTEYQHRNRMYKRWLKNNENQIQTVSDKLNRLMGAEAFDQLLKSYEHLEQFYIHESHGPYNSTIGMSAEIEMDDDNVKHLSRTVYFKQAVDFQQVNDDADRVLYRDGRRKKIEIDEFKFVMAKEFK